MRSTHPAHCDSLPGHHHEPSSAVWQCFEFVKIWGTRSQIDSTVFLEGRMHWKVQEAFSHINIAHTGAFHCSSQVRLNGRHEKDGIHTASFGPHLVPSCAMQMSSSPLGTQKKDTSEMICSNLSMWPQSSAFCNFFSARFLEAGSKSLDCGFQ